MQRSMFVVVAASATLLAGAVAGAPETEAPTDTSALPDLENGRAIVVGAHTRDVGSGCFNCHGVDGSGDSAAGFPRLTDQVYKYLYDSLRDYASGVRQNRIMGPIASGLTDEQMRDVSAYYASLRDAPYAHAPDVDGATLQMGAVIAAVGAPEQGVQACVNCHGPDGVGLPPTYPFLAGQHASYLSDQLMAWRTGRRAGDGFAIMEEIAKSLTQEQIQAVSLYYASIRPESVTPETGDTGAAMAAIGEPATRDEGR